MLEAVVYGLVLASFSFVLVATARMGHDLIALACIPPVFVSIVMGFVMGIYAWDSWGPAVVGPAAVLPGAVAWRVATQRAAKDVLLWIYLVWAIGLVLALVAMRFPDQA